MTTVLTVGGANYGLRDAVGDAMGGYAIRHGRRRQKVKYPQAMSKASYLAGLKRLRTDVPAALATGEPVELMGHSLGAEIIGAWLDEIAGTPQAPDPEQLTRIMLLGNPERKYGGAWQMGFPWSHGFLRKRRPTPTNTPYRIDDYARLGDPWANADQWGITRRRSATALSLSRLLGGGQAHADYDDIDIDKCQVRATEGRTTFLVAP